MKPMILISVVVLVFLAWGLSAGAEDSGTITPPAVGGQCAYKQYQGSARIVSITKGSYSNSGSYEVKFLFYPNQEISEDFAHVEGKEVLLLTKLGRYPGNAYLQNNGIEVGKGFDCILNVIVKGTCTPIRFEFPSFRE